MSHALGCLSCTLVRFSLSPLPAWAPCHGHQHRRRGRRNACQRQRQKQRRQNAAAAHAGRHEFKATLEMLVADPGAAACVRALWRRLKGRVRFSIPQSTVCRTTFSPNLPSRSHLNGPKQLRKGLGQVAFFPIRCPPRCPERWEILRESIKCHCYNSWNTLRPAQPGFLRHICGRMAWLLHVECWRAIGGNDTGMQTPPHARQLLVGSPCIATFSQRLSATAIRETTEPGRPIAPEQWRLMHNVVTATCSRCASSSRWLILQTAGCLRFQVAVQQRHTTTTAF